MKTAKILIFATLLVFTSVSISNADGFAKKPPAKKVINITLLQAIQDPALVIAMYQQIDPGFLKYNQASYTKEVTFHNYLVRVTGTAEQWIQFFKAKPNWE